MMAEVIGVVLATFCLAAVAFPFFRRRGVSSQYTDPILELQQRREAIYQEVRTLHNDYTLGDVSQANYEERLQTYRLQAARLLQQQEQLQELDQWLEGEVLRFRDVALISSDSVPCPECGRPVDWAMEQCLSCGTVLSGAAPDHQGQHSG